MRIQLNFVMLLMVVVAATAAAAPDEARGTVIGVESGDIFDVRIDEADPRTVSEVERVILAGVVLPPVESVEGKAAKEFAEALLMNRTVWLDIDDESGNGRDSLGRLICVIYLEKPAGEINLTHPFNRILVEAGHAEVGDFEDGEFDPMDWWPDEDLLSEGESNLVLINEVEANPPGGDADNEWVELYNDGFDDADVGNWTLTTAGGSVVTIQPGTIVLAGWFLVVTADGYWLRNSDETVVLRDEDGLEVDRTPILDDEDDDDYSWSRYPDGEDEWVYIEASPDLPVPPIELSLGTISDFDEEDENWLRWSDGCYPSGLWDVSDFLG
jgi:endonuclease YncB( thermonuclease family)